MFDKLLYWRRRKAGKRGQDPVVSTVHSGWRVDPKPVSKKAILKNTKRARKQNAKVNNQRINN